jgi:hypothetical protein
VDNPETGEMKQATAEAIFDYTSADGKITITLLKDAVALLDYLSGGAALF